MLASLGGDSRSVNAVRLVSRAEAAHQEDHEAHKQDKADAAAAVNRAAEVKAPASEQEEENDDDEQSIHGVGVITALDPQSAIQCPAQPLIRDTGIDPTCSLTLFPSRNIQMHEDAILDAANGNYRVGRIPFRL
jgi:hypothetical protein